MKHKPTVPLRPTLKDLTAAANAAGVTVTVSLEPRLLYNATKETRETYSFQINSGGELGVEETGTVTITFLNGKFEKCHFPFAGNYTRNGWRILAAIEQKISEIEAQL